MAGLSGLFDPPPPRWGLRGDPLLWARMAEGFAGQPLPNTEAALRAMVAGAFRRQTGQDWAGDAPIAVAALTSARGGLSNGLVAPDWWRQTGVELLAERWRAAAP